MNIGGYNNKKREKARELDNKTRLLFNGSERMT
jgi:hypothetical protein